MEDELYKIIENNLKKAGRPEEKKMVVRLGNKDIVKLKKDIFNKICDIDVLLQELKRVHDKLSDKASGADSKDLENIFDRNLYLSNIDNSIKMCKELYDILKKGYASVSQEYLISIYNSFYVVESFGDEDKKMSFKEYCEDVIKKCKESMPQECPVCKDYNRHELKNCKYCGAKLPEKQESKDF